MKINNFDNIIKDESGAVAIITAVVLFFVLIGIAALAIDIGRVTTTKNELQNAADAAALAGAGELGRQYINDSSYNESMIKSTAKTTAESNNAANETIAVDWDEIYIGWWKSEINGQTFIPGNDDGDNPGNDPYNAVKVVLKKDGIRTFFAGILGFDSLGTNASATAALTGPSLVGPGEVNVPFGVSQQYFDGGCQDDSLLVFGSSDSCVAWHNFEWPHNTSEMRRQWLGIINHHTTPDDSNLSDGNTWLENFDGISNININGLPTHGTPAIQVGISFNYTEGVVGSLYQSLFLSHPSNFSIGGYDGNHGSVLFMDGATPTIYDEEIHDLDDIGEHTAPFPALFDYFRYRDGNDDNQVWNAYVPIYAEPKPGHCEPINGSHRVIGFAHIDITGWSGPPNNVVYAEIDCDWRVVQGRGGGLETNLIASIPNLVE